MAGSGGAQPSKPLRAGLFGDYGPLSYSDLVKLLFADMNKLRNAILDVDLKFKEFSSVFLRRICIEYLI